MAYARAGTGDPIVFLHNGGSTHVTWLPQFERFAQTHDVVALDLLGFGDSRMADGTTQSLDSHVDALESLIDQLQLGGVTLVGNCMGSATALAYTQRRPDKVRGVFALNVLTQGTIRAGVLGPLARLGERLPRLAMLIGGIPPPAFVRRRLVLSQLANAEAAPEIVRELCSRLGDRRHYASLAAVTTEIDSYDGRRPDKGPPIHVAWGAKNAVLPLRMGQKLMETLQPDTFTVVADAGHLAMLDKPEEVTDLIDDLLAQATPQSGTY
jgi:pimeloyl-ACP methyl ester carboxylesterase